MYRKLVQEHVVWLRGIPLKLNKSNAYGILLMLIAALTTCGAQFLWKVAISQLALVPFMLGVVLYGIGASLMIVSFKFGEASVLHPILSVGYIGSLVLGCLFLNEVLTVSKISGVALILVGVGLLFVGSCVGKEQ